MLVKKINSEWNPTENNGLKVGDTIEITDPKELILSGMVVAVDSDGLEKTSYELYGVLAGDEKEEYEQWLAVKKQKELSESLAKEKEALVKESKELEAKEKEAAKKEEKPATVEKDKSVKK